jgi:hypothetical protein
MEELVIVVQTLVGEDLCEKKAQSLREYVEEIINLAPQKPKKKKNEHSHNLLSLTKHLTITLTREG